MVAMKAPSSPARWKIMAQVNVEIVKRSDHAKGFIVSPKPMGRRAHVRVAWTMQRLAKDWEISTAEGF